MNKDRYSGLAKAYSSQLLIEWQDGKEVIVKQVEPQERESELYFQAQLQSLGLSAMEMYSDPRGLIILFIPDAQTLGDKETPELYERLGHTLRLLHAREFDRCFFIDASGNEQEYPWADFVQHTLAAGRDRQNKMQGLSTDTVERITGKLGLEQLSCIGTPRLLHGDLHANNVLIHQDDLYVFDKADQMMAGDPMYDMALFAITLPGALYGVGNEVERDKKFLDALIRGYGFDFSADRGRLDAYVLLRALERCPNPFEPEIPEIVDRILISL
ncbi:TPA: hypothetical protein DEB00_03635 [Candidatus Uhrbacteria bacterium]|nr:hypothetical protein [Candidatus Uhrbacteria bacterium]